MIYLDNAASTRPDDEVLAAMAETARVHFANPAAAHALAAARAEVAAALDVEAEQIVFTSGGTEADALGLLGAARAARGRHLVVGALEHPAVVAVMLVQNELGTLQPVAEIARRLGAGPRRPHLHVDAVQGFGFLRLRPRTLGADTIALSAHKLHGPRGAGALWVRPGARLAPLWVGGGQERGLRGGTENLPALVGFARAVALARRALDGGADARVADLRDRLEVAAIAALAPIVPGV